MNQIRKIEEAIGEIIFHAHPENEPVTIEYIPPAFNLVGYGTDAVVVSHPECKGRVLKVFAEGRLHKVDQEFQVYQKLKGSPYFARCYDIGDNYLILSHEQGMNLYQCLCEGVEIPEQVIIDVEHALDPSYASKLGTEHGAKHIGQTDTERFGEAVGYLCQSLDDVASESSGVAVAVHGDAADFFHRLCDGGCDTRQLVEVLFESLELHFLTSCFAILLHGFSLLVEGSSFGKTLCLDCVSFSFTTSTDSFSVVERTSLFGFGNLLDGFCFLSLCEELCFGILVLAEEVSFRVLNLGLTVGFGLLLGERILRQRP